MNAAAIRGVVYGTSHATINATLTRPMVVADVVMLRMSHGIRYVTSMDTVWNTNAAVRYGAAATPARVVNRRINRMWRMNSFVGDPCWVTGPGLRRETQRRMIAVTAARLAAAEMPPPGIPTTITKAAWAMASQTLSRRAPKSLLTPSLTASNAVEVVHEVVVEHQRNQRVSTAVEHEQANREHSENRDEVGRLSTDEAVRGRVGPPRLMRAFNQSDGTPYERA